MLRGPGRDARQVPGTRSAARPLPNGHVLTGDAPRGFGLSTFWMVRTQLDDVAEQLPRPRSVDVPAKAIRRSRSTLTSRGSSSARPPGRANRRRARLVPARDQLGAAHATRDISSRTTSGAGLTSRDVLHRKAGVARHRQRGLGRRGGRDVPRLPALIAPSSDKRRTRTTTSASQDRDVSQAVPQRVVAWRSWAFGP